MMKTIIRKELLDHLRSVQFAVLLAAGIVLFAANGLVFVQQYTRLNGDYRKAVAANDAQPSTMMTRLHRAPSPLLFMAEGGEKTSPKGYLLGPKLTLSPLPAGTVNFKMPDIPELDWAFIIKIVFSLYIILLGFEAVSGEKERGTLRLVLSNPVGRIKLLTAKYLAIISSAAIPLVAGLLTSLLVIGLFLPSLLSLPNLARIVLFFSLAMAYLSLFAFLSLFFSALIARSSVALLVLLSFWIFFAFFIPDTSVIAADKFSKVPSEYEMAKLVGPTIQGEVWKRIAAIQDRIKKGELKTEQDIREEADRAYEQGQESVRKLYDDYDHAMRERSALAQRISCISPAALFQYAAEAVTETGPSADARFLRDIRNYSRVYDDYILNKLGKVVGASPWGFSTGATLNGKYINLQSPFPQEYSGDKSDFPKFSESRPALVDGLRSGLWDIAGLVIWNIIFAGLAFSAFIRADVR
jgi:ABC-type transport system involved in multi-copper enzyme maturation permease subunit